MHAFDIVFYVFAAIFVAIGIRRGFIEEAVRLIALVVGFICGLLLYRQFIPKLAFLHLSPQLAGITAFLCIFFGCTILLILIGKVIKKIISLTVLGWLDRLLGGCVGAAKVFVIGWIFVIAVVSLPVLGKASFFRESPVFSFFVTISPILKGQVLRHAQIPAPRLPNNLINTLKGFGGGKDSAVHKEPVRKKIHFDDKNTL